MTHTIAISNQKGGVGKTTSAISLGTELALLGKRVLLIDFDPQGNATSGVGVTKDEEAEIDLYDLFFGRAELGDLVKPGPVAGFSVVPSSPDLVGVEIELGKTAGRELILRDELREIEHEYDYVLIDCPPSCGLLTLNAMGAADSVIIPLQAEYYALEGISSLMDTIEFVRQTFNPELYILGVFLTMYDSRTNLSSQVQEEAESFFNGLLFETAIPRNIRLSEAPSHGLPIAVYDSSSAGAKAYHKLAIELDARCGPIEEGRVANG